MLETSRKIWGQCWSWSLNLEFTCARDTEALHSSERKTATMSHMSSRVPPNLRVQLFRLFSRNPHDSCIPCKEKHGLQCSLGDCNDKILPQCNGSSFSRDIVATTVTVTFHLQSTLNSILHNVFTDNDMYTFNMKKYRIKIIAKQLIMNTIFEVAIKYLNEYFDQDRSQREWFLERDGTERFVS